MLKTRNSHSPWGNIQEVTNFGEHICFVSTASHGGFHLDDEAVAIFKKFYGDTLNTFTGTLKWLEEDLDACLVPVCFPDLFMGEEVKQAKKLIAREQKYFQLPDSWIEQHC